MNQVANRLLGQEARKLALTEKNLQLEMANAGLRKEIASLQREASQAGVVMPRMPSEIAREIPAVPHEELGRSDHRADDNAMEES